MLSAMKGNTVVLGTSIKSEEYHKGYSKEGDYAEGVKVGTECVRVVPYLAVKRDDHIEDFVHLFVFTKEPTPYISELMQWGDNIDCRVSEWTVDEEAAFLNCNPLLTKSMTA